MFSARLKSLREQANLSREHLAKALDITYSALSKYETGKREPDYTLLEKIANYFEVSTDYLLGRTDSPDLTQHEKDEAEFQAFRNNPNLNRFYKELPASDEEAVERLRQIWEIIKNEKK